MFDEPDEDDDDEKERRRQRGGYRCSKCGQPKKGHICPYQPRLRKREAEAKVETKNAEAQVELDAELVVRRLNLEVQGYPESYATVSTSLVTPL